MWKIQPFALNSLNLKLNDVNLKGFAISGDKKKDDEGIYLKESDVIFFTQDD